MHLLKSERCACIKLRQVLFKFLFLFSLLLSAHGIALAAPLCSQVFHESWAISRIVEKNKFVTMRGIFDYRDMLGKEFSTSLESLKSDQLWVDLGAGKANAQVEFLKTFKDVDKAPWTVAIAYKLDRWFSPPKFSGKLQIREGAFEAQDVTSWKKADLITDVFGVVSYTHDLHTTLQKAFDLMNVNGEFYIFMTYYSLSIHRGEARYGLIDFLKTIEGIKVEGKYGTIRITKTSPEVTVPSMILEKYVDDAPPVRTFRVAPDEGLGK